MFGGEVVKAKKVIDGHKAVEKDAKQVAAEAARQKREAIALALKVKHQKDQAFKRDAGEIVRAAEALDADLEAIGTAENTPAKPAGR